MYASCRVQSAARLASRFVARRTLKAGRATIILELHSPKASACSAPDRCAARTSPLRPIHELRMTNFAVHCSQVHSLSLHPY